MPGRTASTVWENSTLTSKFVSPLAEEASRVALFPTSVTVPSKVVNGSSSNGPVAASAHSGTVELVTG